MQGQVRYMQNTSHPSSYCRSFAYHAVIYLPSLYDHYARHSFYVPRLDQVVPPLVISSSNPCVLSAQLPVHQFHPSHPIAAASCYQPALSRPSPPTPNLLCRWISDWPALRFLVFDNNPFVRSSIAPVTLLTPQLGTSRTSRLSLLMYAR